MLKNLKSMSPVLVITRNLWQSPTWVRPAP